MIYHKPASFYNILYIYKAIKDAGELLNVGMTTLVNLESTSNSQPLFLYEFIACGADTWTGSLGKGRQVVSCDKRLRSENKIHRTNYFRTNWSKYSSLDLLLVQDNHLDKQHKQWMVDWGDPSRARHLLLLHGAEFLTAGEGKRFKSWCKAVRGKGYDIHTWHVNAIHCGSSLYSNHVVTFCYPKGSRMGLQKHDQDLWLIPLPISPYFYFWNHHHIHPFLTGWGLYMVIQFITGMGLSVV